LGSRGAHGADEPGLVEGRLGRIASDLVEPLVGLNSALAEDGLVLLVDDGVAVAAPIEVVHLSATGDRAVAYHPRSLIAVGKGALVTLVEHHLGIAVGPAAGATFEGVAGRVAGHPGEVGIAEEEVLDRDARGFGAVPRTHPAARGAAVAAFGGTGTDAL
jgi:hypothetical protein